jgi:transposase
MAGWTDGPSRQKITETILIDAPPAKVWATIADFHESRRVGRVSRCGDDMMRTLLYEAAQVMLARVQKWSPLKAWAANVAKRRGLKKAIVALARRLAVVMHHMWIDGSVFRWTTKTAPAVA